ncbi:MAG: malto-oligosyltrehalose synthase [Polyangiaceae bacterium]|nr:malto-oligosyltrehalose synthase [Polyangiaceae bacterium]
MPLSPPDSLPFRGEVHVDSSARITPNATYRLQLRPGFGFDHAAALCDFLADLGVSHAYFSPYLQAAPGSTHGYDVIDYSRVNDELGGAEGHARLTAALRQHGLGQVIDVVPNHMAISSRHNRWWWDVLENGPASPYAPYFDVDWKTPNELQRNKVLLPILGDHYGRVLEAGEIQIAREGASFFVMVFDRQLPVAPPTLDHLLERAAAIANDDELEFLAESLRSQRAITDSDREGRLRRRRQQQVIERLLRRHLHEKPNAAHAVDRALGELNADAELLDSLLERQNYRLAFWRTARHDLDYRRFFDINELAGLRIGAERVFRESHALVLKWVEEGHVDGIRIDHPDGMRDPEKYFRRLRAAAPRAWLVAEKILEPDEALPATWPIDGTTGYDFVFVATALFVAAEHEGAMTRLYRDFTGDTTEDYRALVRDTKRQILEELLGADLYRLARTFHGVCALHRRHRDFTLQDLRDAVKQVIACLPVYRTYVRAGSQASEADEQRIAEAIRQAKLDRPTLDVELLSFMGEILTGRLEGETEWDLAARFQQLSGPAMAKGVEDTAFYRYTRLVCLNEVGSDPARFGVSVASFHRFCADVAENRPRTMLSTSTHDTKRSEDVRARIAVLSQIPALWAERVKRWSRMAATHRTRDLPDRITEYLFWQTLVGAWPISADRLTAYMRKATREAKVWNSWTRVNTEYETALEFFARQVLQDQALMDDFSDFVAEIEPSARIASLATVVLKLTAPGVPDLYQGNELWDHSLVDPDNRRAVDFELRRRLLAELGGSDASDVLARSEEGMPKLWVIQRALRLRADRPEWFGPGSAYLPLPVDGVHADRVVAFSRGGQAVTIVPCRCFDPPGGWQDTAVMLPAGIYLPVFTDGPALRGRIEVGPLFAEFPVVLLAAEDR